MICDLEDIRNDSIMNAAKVFKGSATAIKQEGNMMRIPFGDYQAVKTKAAATFLAERQAVKVQEWAEKKFKKVYSFGWTEIDKTMSDVIKVSIKFPKSLYESYKVKKGMQTMAEMELALMGEDYFKQQDEVSNVVDEVEQSEVKEGVNFVFEQNPELSEIGTQQLYSQYLNQNPNGNIEGFKEFVGKTTQKDNKVELESNLKELNKVDNQEGVENLRESMLRDFNSYYPQYSDLAQWEKETMIDMMMEGELITYC